MLPQAALALEGYLLDSQDFRVSILKLVPDVALAAPDIHDYQEFWASALEVAPVAIE